MGRMRGWEAEAANAYESCGNDGEGGGGKEGGGGSGGCGGGGVR